MCNRPEKKNALTRAMYVAMTDALEQAEQDPSVRTALFSGSGDSFSAGNDIGDFRQSADDESPSGVSAFSDRIVRFSKPLIAAVNGLAVGIGATMLLHCDIVYANESARFRLPFIDLGLVPELASSMLLPRLAGYHRAAELFLLGRFFDATEAKEIGLVNYLLPATDLLARATEAARAIAVKPPQAVAQTRALLKGDIAPVLAYKAHADAIFAERRRSPEAQAMFAAFFAPGPG
jgi:enoyl-CoA hydratase/carnithine racemase